jgi:hypothetical protein
MSNDNTQGVSEPSPASAGSRGDAVCDRITAYLFSGGLFNPEMANHDAVRDLLIDARAEIERLRVNLRLADAGFTLGEPTLTDEERSLLTKLGSDTREWDKYSNGRPWFVRVADAAIIRGLLDRLK